jgi:hypothetical protein
LRRFELADLSRHGGWLIARMLKAFPHLTDRTVAGFLRGSMESNEFLFLCGPQSAALFQVENGYSLAPQPVIRERFIWVENPEDKLQAAQSAYFYDHVIRWAKTMGAEILILGDLTDVPPAAMKEKLSRSFTREQKFARL